MREIINFGFTKSYHGILSWISLEAGKMFLPNSRPEKSPFLGDSDTTVSLSDCHVPTRVASKIMMVVMVVVGWRREKGNVSK